jgi:hypothetical protein
MKCPVCIQEGQKSTLRDRGGTRTLMACWPFYDEEGRHHHHDYNTSTYGYTCSRGHEFSVARKGTCWCGWNKDTLPSVSVYKGLEDPRSEEEKDRKGHGVVITDPEVLKAMTAGEGSEFSILGTGPRHGCGND